jgi:hypothetical protein
MAGLVTELVEPPTETVKPAGGLQQPTWRSWFAAGMLALAVLPIAVAVGRAIATGWVPISDAGYFTVRSRDVLTADHPWLGAWSSSSFGLGATVHNLGPLQLDLLAPFTKAEPYGGTAVGVGAVAAASVVAVWWSARRVLGALAAGGAMIVTIALEAAVGSQAFIDPRQQLYLLMPYWALLWLAWTTAVGHGVAIAPLAFTASLIAQTHFTYLFQAAIVVAAALGLYLVAVRRRWHETHAARWLLIGLAVTVISWSQTIWDQLAGERNLGAVLAESGSSDGIGWSDGVRVIAGTVLRPPTFWVPGTMDDFALPIDMVALSTAVVTLVVWFALLVAAVVVSARRGDRELAVLAAIAVAALSAAIVAGSEIPLTSLSYARQNYFWMWPTGAFATAALGAILITGAMRWSRRRGAAPVALGFTAGGVVFAVVACHPADNFSATAGELTAGERVARPIVDQLGSAIRRSGITGPVLVDGRRSSFGNDLGYSVLAELQDAGVEFTFRPGDQNVDRFGRRRCDEGRAETRIVLADAGGDPAPREGETVLAHVDGFSDADAAELEALDRRFGEWLRDGSVDLDVSTLEYLAGRELPELQVLETPGRSATGLAALLGPWPNWGVLDVPAELEDEFNRWIDLQKRSTADIVTVLLAPMPERDHTASPVSATACLR